MRKLVQKSKLCMKTLKHLTFYVFVSFISTNDVYNAYQLSHTPKRNERQRTHTHKKKTIKRTPILLISVDMFAEAITQTHTFEALPKLAHITYENNLVFRASYFITQYAYERVFTRTYMFSIHTKWEKQRKKKKQEDFRCTYTYAKNGYH